MSSPSYDRWWTKRWLDRCIAKYGNYHVATFAAAARAVVAWGGQRMHTPAMPPVLTHDEYCELAEAYSRAHNRARECTPFVNNRRQRRYWRERAARFDRERMRL